MSHEIRIIAAPCFLFYRKHVPVYGRKDKRCEEKTDTRKILTLKKEKSAGESCGDEDEGVML